MILRIIYEINIDYNPDTAAFCGAHCRTAVGAASMPFDAMAEIEAEFYLRDTADPTAPK